MYLLYRYVMPVGLLLVLVSLVAIAFWAFGMLNNLDQALILYVAGIFVAIVGTRCLGDAAIGLGAIISFAGWGFEADFLSALEMLDKASRGG